MPPDHPDSNYGLAQRELLAQVPIAAGHVHRAPTEIGSAEQAAAAWEHALREFFLAPAGSMVFPEFDLVILGVGADGHTASLFPGAPALDVSRRWVAATAPVGTPPVPRLTLTLPVFNHAREVLFLAAGPDKKRPERRTGSRELQRPSHSRLGGSVRAPASLRSPMAPRSMIPRALSGFGGSGTETHK